ncbi:MAG: PAS domain S-box protein [Proteobacteria bacterium]|nr:PAS domain S-box protein [Pseudomonadota bacterium]MBU1742862.1 PAS domain S-box protein [Pseudomonadota bacterium]
MSEAPADQSSNNGDRERPGMAHVSLGGKILWANPRLAEIWGQKRDDLVSRDLWAAVPADKGPGDWERMRRLLDADTPLAAWERRDRRGDGPGPCLRYSSTLMRRPGGEPDYFILIVEQTDDRRCAEESAALLARFPVDTPYPFLLVAADGVIQYANPASAGLMSLTGRPVGESAPAPIADQVRASSDNGCGREFEVRMDDREYLFVTAPWPHSDMVLVYGHDVTDRRRLWRRQPPQRRDSVAGLEGLVVADVEGVVILVNPSYTAITGYTLEETIGRGINLFRSDNIDPGMIENLWDDLIVRGQWSGEHSNRRKNGDTYPEWLTLSVVKGCQGQVRSYIGLFNDLSQIKRD